MQSTTLASSTGWKEKEPMWTHSLAPPRLSPKWGTSGKRSSTTATARSR